MDPSVREYQFNGDIEDFLQRASYCYDGPHIPGITEEAIDFLNKHPNPNDNPYAGSIRTRDIKIITKVAGHNMKSNPKSYDSPTLDALVNYYREGISRIESGKHRIEKDNKNGFTKMLCHNYAHLGEVIELQSAYTIHPHNEILLNQAYETHGKAIALSAIHDPIQIPWLLKRQSETAQLIASISTHSREWLECAIDHGIEAAEKFLPHEPYRAAHTFIDVAGCYSDLAKQNSPVDCLTNAVTYATIAAELFKPLNKNQAAFAQNFTARYALALFKVSNDPSHKKLAEEQFNEALAQLQGEPEFKTEVAYIKRNLQFISKRSKKPERKWRSETERRENDRLRKYLDDSSVEFLRGA